MATQVLNIQIKKENVMKEEMLLFKNAPKKIPSPK